MDTVAEHKNPFEPAFRTKPFALMMAALILLGANFAAPIDPELDPLMASAHGGLVGAWVASRLHPSRRIEGAFVLVMALAFVFGSAAALVELILGAAPLSSGTRAFIGLIAFADLILGSIALEYGLAAFNPVGTKAQARLARGVLLWR